MIAPLLLALLAAAGAQGGCADHWSVALNAESFAGNGAGKAFSAAELEAFRARIEARLRSAIGDACARGAVKPAAARAVRQVEVSSASGASASQNPMAKPDLRSRSQCDGYFRSAGCGR